MVSTATAVNAGPVAEFSIAAIIFALKRVQAALINYHHTRDKRGEGRVRHATSVTYKESK